MESIAPTPDDAGNSAAKFATPSPLNGVSLPVGAHPGATGGKKGRSGRKPDAFKAKMRQLVSSNEKLKHLETVLNNPNHPSYVVAYKMAAEIGYGKALQPVEHSGPNGGPISVSVTHTIVDPKADAGDDQG